MFLRVIVLSVLLSFPFGVQAGPKEDAQAVFDKFLTLFTAANAEEITGLFADDALFWGTGSRDLVTSKEGVRKYFDNAFGNPPRAAGGVRAFSLGITPFVLNDNLVLVSGMWQNERIENGKAIQSPQLRVSLIVTKRGDRWVISQFHNSLRPNPQ